MRQLIIRSISLALLISLISAQAEIDKLIEDVYRGNTQAAEESIYKLREKFPENPSLLFLIALIDNNVERSIDKYKEIFNLYPESEYADDAVMKLSEYYYTKGSYFQSAEWAKKINLYYSQSEHINRSLNMYLRGLILIGKEDTANFYVQSFKKKYPDISYEDFPELESVEQKVQEKKENEKNKLLEAVKNIKKSLLPTNNIDPKKHFSIQVGAYGNIDNASRVRDELLDLNFNARVDVIYLQTKEKNLYAVREGYFKSKEYARSTQKKIKSRTGYDSIVVDINK